MNTCFAKTKRAKYVEVVVQDVFPVEDLDAFTSAVSTFKFVDKATGHEFGSPPDGPCLSVSGMNAAS